MNTQFRNGHASFAHRPFARTILFTLCAAALFWTFPEPSAAESEVSRTVGGLKVFLDVLPSAVMKQQKSITGKGLHGVPPPGGHVYHVMVSVVDAASGEKQRDLGVRARVSGLGLGDPEKDLLPITIDKGVGYGNYFILPPNETYKVQVDIRRPGQAELVRVDFVHDHRVH